MKVNSTNKRDISFNGFLTSNTLKKGLKFASENGALFAATTSLVLSSTVRPLAILATPKTDKKNKQIACAKSITSTTIGYLIMLLFSMPLANSIKKIDAEPAKYLTNNAINKLKNGENNLTKSKAYSLATQLFKLGLGFVLAVPKAILTAIGTPYTLDFFNINDNVKENKKDKNKIKNINFKGKNNLSSRIGKIINKDWYINFANKYKDSNFPMHIIATTDILTTATFIGHLNKNKKMKKDEKKPLIYNSTLSTLLSIASGYLIDKATEKPTEKFITAFSKANKSDVNLNKYIEGIKIGKPILILGTVYYMLIPIISTFFADRIDRKNNYSSTDKPSFSAASSINL